MGIRRHRAEQPTIGWSRVLPAAMRDILSSQGVDLTTALLTRKEVEVIAGIPPSVLNTAIEQKVVPVRDAQIDPYDLAALTFIRDLPFPLSVVAKRALAAWMRIAAEGDDYELAPGLMARRTPATDAIVREAPAYIADRERYYNRDPEIMGGEPVVKGTRVPLRSIAAAYAAGDTFEVLARSFPHVEPAAFRFALRWAECHPQRGRPVGLPEYLRSSVGRDPSPARAAARAAYIASRAERRAAFER
jgi:uncharacterized protein (DUF433 family)